MRALLCVIVTLCVTAVTPVLAQQSPIAPPPMTALQRCALQVGNLAIQGDTQAEDIDKLRAQVEALQKQLKDAAKKDEPKAETAPEAAPK